MAQLTINVPDAQVPRILAAFAPRAGKEVEDMTPADAKAVIVDLIKKIVIGHERDLAMAAIQDNDVDVT